MEPWICWEDLNKKMSEPNKAFNPTQNSAGVFFRRPLPARVNFVVRRQGSVVSDSIISYIEMCRREGASLQQGMNFGLGGNHSVILMSVRPNAPYRDRLGKIGTAPICPFHIISSSRESHGPWLSDFPITSPNEAIAAGESSKRNTTTSSLRNGS